MASTVEHWKLENDETMKEGQSQTTRTLHSDVARAPFALQQILRSVVRQTKLLKLGGSRQSWQHRGK